MTKQKTPKYKETTIPQRTKLVYDINALPKGLPPDDFVKLFNNHDLVLWDSSKEGVKPALYGVDGKAPLMVLDTKGNEMDLSYYTHIVKEKEKWDKELYNCQNSPIYYFRNYGTSVWPHTDKDLKAFLKSIDIKNYASKDSTEAQKLWEAQKAQMKKAMSFVTVEFLKERAGVIEILKKEYEDKLLAMEYAVRDHVELKKDDNTSLEAKTKALRIVKNMKRLLPVDKRYAFKYRTKKGRWDSGLLLATDYGVILEMYYEILKSKNKIKDILDSTT